MRFLLKIIGAITIVSLLSGCELMSWREQVREASYKSDIEVETGKVADYGEELKQSLAFEASP